MKQLPTKISPMENGVIDARDARINALIDYLTPEEPQTVGEAAATGRVGGMLKSIFESEKDWGKFVCDCGVYDDGLCPRVEKVKKLISEAEENGKKQEYQKMKNKINNLVERYETMDNRYYASHLVKDLKKL